MKFFEKILLKTGGVNLKNMRVKIIHPVGIIVFFILLIPMIFVGTLAAIQENFTIK